MTTTRIVIFAKAPVAGAVKTRLIPALGGEGAARLAATMLKETVSQALAAGLGVPIVCVTPDHDDTAWRGFLPEGVEATGQGPGDLGRRMGTAARNRLEAGERVLLIGTDCPALDAARLSAAALQLDRHDAVLHPAEDGGYVLLGLRLFDPTLFADIAWSTATVAHVTRTRIEALGWSLFVGDTLRDIDEPGDLEWAEPEAGSPIY